MHYVRSFLLKPIQNWNVFLKVSYSIYRPIYKTSRPKEKVSPVCEKVYLTRECDITSRKKGNRKWLINFQSKLTLNWNGLQGTLLLPRSTFWSWTHDNTHANPKWLLYKGWYITPWILITWRDGIIRLLFTEDSFRHWIKCLDLLICFAVYQNTEQLHTKRCFICKFIINDIYLFRNMRNITTWSLDSIPK